jgi:type I restriction enzyme S subunit
LAISFDLKSLENICKIKQGKYLSPKEMSETASPDNPIPVIGGNGILGYTNKPSHSIDVPLVTCRGSKCGLIQWAKAPVWVSNNAIACDTGTLLGNQFLRYLFEANLFDDVITGSAQPQITIGHLSKKVFAICSKAYWSDAVGALSAFDDRITLLRETNTTLEAIAQAIFKSWFVDFDPVRAKSLGKLPEGMDEATAALFPDAFKETELGMVPKGWQVVAVGDVAEIVKGKSYSSKDLVENHSTALVTLKSFERGGGFRMDGFKPYQGAYKPNQVVNAGDLIVAYTDVTQAAELIGKPALVVAVEEHDTLVASLDVGIVRPTSSNCGKQFLFGLFKTEDFQRHTFAHTSGTTVLHLSKDGIGSYSFPLPPKELCDQFEQIALALADRRQTNTDKIRTLGLLRDTLLPRLISGQLRIADAEAELEKVTA